MIYTTFLKSKLSVLVATAIVLGGCGGTGTETAQSPSSNDSGSTQQTPSAMPMQVTETIIAEQGLTPRQRLTKAINSLEDGQSEVARVELQAYLEAVPNSSRASNLMQQIVTDSADFYPSEFFTVTLRSGQSLSTLAKEYLGSAWEFYALAKYNNISNPSRVNIGTDIKVPLTQLARSVKAKEEAEALAGPVEIEVIEDASIDPEAIANLDTEELVDESDTVTDGLLAEQELSEPELPEVTAETLVQDLTLANSLQNYAESVTIIEALKSFGPMPADTQPMILEAFEGHVNNISEEDPVTAANLLLEIGQIYIENGEEILAFESYKQATIADINNSQANTQMLTIQKSITEKYHREASTAFRQQELNEAIEKWDVVLSVDPNHSNAMAYRTQAIELKERLDLLKGN